MLGAQPRSCPHRSEPCPFLTIPDGSSSTLGGRARRVAQINLPCQQWPGFLARLPVPGRRGATLAHFGSEMSSYFLPSFLGDFHLSLHRICLFICGLHQEHAPTNKGLTAFVSSQVFADFSFSLFHKDHISGKLCVTGFPYRK